MNPKNIRYTKIWVQPKVQQNIVDPKNYLEPEKMHATLKFVFKASLLQEFRIEKIRNHNACVTFIHKIKV